MTRGGGAGHNMNALPTYPLRWQGPPQPLRRGHASWRGHAQKRSCPFGQLLAKRALPRRGGGDNEIRTRGLYVANVALYQLSHIPDCVLIIYHSPSKRQAFLTDFCQSFLSHTGNSVSTSQSYPYFFASFHSMRRSITSTRPHFRP